ncbi:uncharacterized protein LOC126827415 [Patella vulgata]|uniref:uncharacterized protein LOC126827415 n=1 Tax=Patella vulgata TaxID=6465 RepID=UPI00217F8057|nr:uncharacterized protein LOC126827415 [Patella vulgata]
MSIQYQRQYDDEITTDDDPNYRHDLSTTPQALPKVIGIFQVISGLITAFLGTMEVFIIPLTSGENDFITLDKQNCFGAGILAGTLMVLTGSTAIRATISNRETTMARFYNLTIITFLLYMCVTILLIVGYGIGWTTPDKYPPKSHVRELHIYVTVSTMFGLLFAMTALVKYFNIVFGKRVRLAQRWLACCCCCPKNKNPDVIQQTRQTTDANYLM